MSMCLWIRAEQDIFQKKFKYKCVMYVIGNSQQIEGVDEEKWREILIVNFLLEKSIF